MFLYDNNFTVRIYFDEIISESSFNEYIAILTSENILYRHYDNVIIIEFKNVKPESNYLVQIDNRLESIDGNKLIEDNELVFITQQSIAIEYIVHFPTDSKEYLSGNCSGEFINPAKLTNQLERLELRFSQSVDRKLVERIINECITSDEARYTITWQENSLFLDFIEFMNYDLCSFYIAFEEHNSLDSICFIHDFWFTIDEPTTVYSYNFITGDIIKEYTFNDKLYDVGYNNYLDNYFLAVNDDTDTAYYCNMNSDEMNEFPQEVICQNYLGMTPWEEEIQWVNENTILYHDPETLTFYTYNFLTKENIELFQVSNEIEEYTCSPDGSLIAVAE